MLFNKALNQKDFFENLILAADKDPAFKEALEITEKINTLTIENSHFSFNKLAEVMVKANDQSLVNAFELIEFGSFCMAYFGAEMLRQGQEREDIVSLSNIKVFAAKLASGALEFNADKEQIKDFMGKRYPNLEQRKNDFFRTE